MDLIWGLVGWALAARELLILFAAYWLVTELAKRHAPENGLSVEAVSDAGAWLGFGAVVGARLAHALPEWPAYLRYPLDLLRIQGGLSFYGGVAGALAVAAWLARRKVAPLGPLGDLFAPYVALGIAVQRAGCLVRGDCFGTAAPTPFGLAFPGMAQPRLPAELFEALLALGLFAGLAAYRDRRRFVGEVGLLFLLVYPFLRAVVDFARINLGAWPTTDQLVSLTVATVAGALIVRCGLTLSKGLMAAEGAPVSRPATSTVRTEPPGL